MNGPWMDLLFDLILITFRVLIAAVPSHLYTAVTNRRQALQERLYRVESDVRQSENLGIRYWLRAHEDSSARELASEIKRTRARIGRELGRLASGRSNEAAFDTLITFTQAITNGDFEVNSRVAEDCTERIGVAADALIFEVRDHLRKILSPHGEVPPRRRAGNC